MSQIDLGIEDSDRAEIAKGLSKLLADSFQLYLKTHSFHWNVEGPMFSTLHNMFMEQYTELWQALDEIAERIRSLGHYAPGTFSKYAEIGSIKESAEDLSAEKMIEELLHGHEAVAKTARSIFPAGEKGKDEASLDLLTQRLQVHEKTAWMLRSLIA